MQMKQNGSYERWWKVMPFSFEMLLENQFTTFQNVLVRYQYCTKHLGDLLFQLVSKSTQTWRRSNLAIILRLASSPRQRAPVNVSVCMFVSDGLLWMFELNSICVNLILLHLSLSPLVGPLGVLAQQKMVFTFIKCNLGAETNINGKWTRGFTIVTWHNQFNQRRHPYSASANYSLLWLLCCRCYREWCREMAHGHIARSVF